MVEYVEPPPNPELAGPKDACAYSTLRKPKGILKNSRTTDCLPGSPMSDIVVTYSEQRGVVGGVSSGRADLASGGAGGGGLRSTQTLGRNHTFANHNLPTNHPHHQQRLSSFVGPAAAAADNFQRGDGGSDAARGFQHTLTQEKTGLVQGGQQLVAPSPSHVTAAAPRVGDLNGGGAQGPDIILESSGVVNTSKEQLFVL